MPLWLVPVLLSLASVASAAGLTVNIEGLPKELKEAVEGQLTLRNYANRDVTPAQVRRLFNNAEAEIRTALVRQGLPVANAKVTGRGERELRVPTADGVAEPRNRRVEVIIR